MTDDRPLVSIVLPTYNREPLLRQAIASVFAQTFGRWELIVVDDASTDGTATYLHDLHDPRVRVIPHARCGSPPHLRNVGIACADGAYLAFLDSDDIWVPEKLKLQLAALGSSPQCRWCFSHFTRIDEHGARLVVPGTKPPLARTGWILPAILRDEVAIAMPAVVAERSLVLEAGTFDESLAFCSDHDLWLRLAARAPAVALTAPLAMVRAHASNYTRGRDIEAYELLKHVYDKLLTDLTDHQLRVLARHRYARALLSLAALYRNAGRPFLALRALQHALRYRGVHRAWWGALVRALVRPLIPDRVMARYYTWRGGAGRPSRAE